MDITRERASTKNFNSWLHDVYKKGKTFAVCEQAEMYLPTRLNLAKYPNIQLFIQSARHRDCGGVFISRRFSCLSTTVVALSDFVYLFRMFSPSDLRQASMYIHGWKQLPTLKRGWFFQFSDKGEQLCRPIRRVRK